MEQMAAHKQSQRLGFGPLPWTRGTFSTLMGCQMAGALGSSTLANFLKPKWDICLFFIANQKLKVLL